MIFAKFERACTSLTLLSRISWRQLPEPNSSFLDKITSGMVQSNHMKWKKICPTHYIPFISSIKFFEISQKKNTFWKNAIPFAILPCVFFKHIFSKSQKTSSSCKGVFTCKIGFDTAENEPFKVCCWYLGRRRAAPRPSGGLCDRVEDPDSAGRALGSELKKGMY